MTIRYRYIGIYAGSTPIDRPAGVLRVWTDAHGQRREESFRSSLTWEPSDVLDPMARPDYDEYIEINEVTVAGFIAQMHQRFGGEGGLAQGR